MKGSSQIASSMLKGLGVKDEVRGVFPAARQNLVVGRCTAPQQCKHSGMLKAQPYRPLACLSGQRQADWTIDRFVGYCL
jgi:hypothetical protein